MSVEFLTVAMFVSLIVAIIFGHPLAYTLAAVATLFGLIDNGFNIAPLFDMFANNAWGLMKTTCWWPSRCLFSWPSCWTAPR
jgi:TRAP-type mannitol/chloroaromatic compound transport system permease large subunit